VLMPLGRVFRTATLALPATIRKFVGATGATFRTLHMLSMACHQIGVALVTRLSNCKSCFSRHQTMLTWSDLMV
jgi:hypothetical protein